MDSILRSLDERYGTPGATGGPTTVTATGGDSILRSLDERYGRPGAPDERLTLSLRGAQQLSPDQWARGIEASRKAGLPIGIGSRNPEEAAKMVTRREFEEAVRMAPAIGAAALRDPNLARLMQDDLRNVVDIELKSREFNGVSPVRGPKASFFSVLSGLGTMAINAPAEWASASKEVLAGALGDTRAAGNYARDSATARARVANARPELSGMSELDRMLLGGAYGGAESAIMNAPGLAAGAIAASTGAGAPAVVAASLAPMFAQVLPTAFSRASAQGLSFSDSLQYGLGQAAVETLTEIPAIGFLAKRMGKEALSKLIGGYLFHNIGPEQVATLAGDALDTAFLPGQSWDQYFSIKGRGEAAIQTFVATVVGGGALAGVVKLAEGLVGPAPEAERAIEASKVLQNMSKFVAASKVRNRDATTMETLLQSLQEENGAPTTLYLDSNVLTPEMQQQLEALMPSVAAQRDEIVAGAMIELPVGELLTKLAGTPLEQQLVPELRTDENALSVREAETFYQSQSQAFEAAAEKLAAQKTQDTAWNASAQELNDTLTGMFTAVPTINKDQARAYVAPLQAFYTTLADRLGIAPAEAYNRYKVTLSSEQIANATLTQTPPARATAADFQRGSVKSILEKGDWAILTASDPGAVQASKEDNDTANAELVAELRAKGFEVLEVVGKYGVVADSYIVLGMTTQQAMELGNRYGQESVLTREGLVYGDGTVQRATGITEHETAPEDFYTEIPSTGALFTVDIDFDKKVPLLDAQLGQRRGALPLLSEAELAVSAIGLMSESGTKLESFAKRGIGGLPEMVRFLMERRAATGEPIYDITNPEDQQKIARIMVAEAIEHAAREGDALAWYDETIDKTVARLALKFPEVDTDPNARAMLLLATAITSQGLNPEDNLALAVDIYSEYRTNGRFPLRGSGESLSVMAGNFAKANDILDKLEATNGGDKAAAVTELRTFLSTPYRAGDLKNAGFSVDEKVDEMVLGSVIFGSKIGFGFYSNLNGNFEPVTIDMWFMRTIGRIAGTLAAFEEGLYAEQVQRFRDALRERGAKGRGLFAAQIEAMLKDKAQGPVNLLTLARTDDQAVIDLARFVASAHKRDYKANRAAFDAKTRVKTELVAAAGNMIVSLDKPKDVPASGGEKQNLRAIVRMAVEGMQQAYGTRVPPAALQALIWYPEQYLYKQSGVKLRVVGQDYAGAAAKLLSEEGFSDADISAADSRRLDRSQAGSTAAGEPGGVLPGAGQPDRVDAPVRDSRAALARVTGTASGNAGGTLNQGSARPVPEYGVARDGATSVFAIHYSPRPQTQLESSKYGTGMRGAEAARIDQSFDDRLRQRIHFYVDGGNGISPENAVGGNMHWVRLNNVYDINEDALGIWSSGGDINAREGKIIDAGFDGYVADMGKQRAAVLLGKHSVAVEGGTLKQTGEPTLVLGEGVPPTSTPLVLTFGGTFNPVHGGHVSVVAEALRQLKGAGYTVEKVLVSPSPAFLARDKAAKSGEKATSTGDRVEMLRLAFASIPEVEVVGDLAKELNTNRVSGRSALGDYAANSFPNTAVVQLAGEDTAPGTPPGFPALYVNQKQGRPAETYYVLGRGKDALSSSMIRRALADGVIPGKSTDREVLQYMAAVLGLSNEIPIDGSLRPLDAENFGFDPPPQTLPNDDPLLVETHLKKTYLDEDGVERPRKELRDAIADSYLALAKPVTGRKPILYLMGGGGAAGKGTIRKQLVARKQIPDDVPSIDPDVLKAALPEYSKMLEAGDSRAAATVHLESSRLSKRIRDSLVDLKTDFVMDVTLASEKNIGDIREIISKGHEVRLFGVVIDPEVAVYRAMKRGQEESRYVPPQELLRAHQSFAANIPALVSLVDQATLFENTDGAELIALAKNGQLEIIDGVLYNQIAPRGEAINVQASTLREVRPSLSRGSLDFSKDRAGGNEVGSEAAGRPLGGGVRGGSGAPARGAEEGTGRSPGGVTPGAFDPNNPSILAQPAYHGTPHRGIDKFSTDKIGTGEGAQVYGWGLYFAGKRAIAEWYRNKLSLNRGAFSLVDKATGEPIAEGTPGAELVKQRMLSYGVDLRASDIDQFKTLWKENIQRLQGRASEYDALREPNAGDARMLEIIDQSVAEDAARVRELEAAIDLIGKVKRNAEGQLYEVDIPEDSEMLLWDRPLSEQPEAVRAALKDLEIPNVSGQNILELDPKGAELYRALARSNGSDRAASEYLASLGIKGVKYLDGTSRGTAGNPILRIGGAVKAPSLSTPAPERSGDIRLLRKNGDLAAALEEARDSDAEPAEIAYLESLRGKTIDVQRADDSTYNYVVFSGDDVAIRNQFYQTPAETVRGQISFAPDIASVASRITLLKDADMSTFLHETGHFMLEVYTDIASKPNPPPEIVKDLEALLKWMGFKGTDDQTPLQLWTSAPISVRREYHETFARGFEAYLREGNAPTVELQPFFSKFRSWLVRIYKTLTQLNVKLSPEVRQVMDRMLASEQQIDESRQIRSQVPLFASAEELGMDEKQWADYQALNDAQREEAISDLQARSIRNMQWLGNARSREMRKLQKKAAEIRKEMMPAVLDEIRKRPVYAARRFLSRGILPDGGQVTGAKLSIPALKEMYGDAANAPWRYLSTGKFGLATSNETEALHPDAVADMFGFTSGDHLVRELLAARPESEEATDIIDRRMLEEYSDLSDEASMNRAIDSALANEARSKFLATELAALTKTQAPIRAMAKAAKEWAAKLVGAKKIRDIKPGTYSAAEAKEGRHAMNELKLGNTARAAIHKRNQLLQHHAARTAADALEEVEKAVAYLKKFDSPGVREKIDQAYLDQIDKILEKFDLRKMSLKAMDQRAALSRFVAALPEGLELDLPDYVQDDAQRVPYRELTLEDFRGVVDSVKMIDHLGRLKEKLLTAKEAREFKAVVDEISTSIDTNGTKTVKLRVQRTAGRSLGKMWRGYLAGHRKMSSLFKEMDGSVENGPLWRYIINPMNDRSDMEATMRAEASAKLRELFAGIRGGEKFGGGGMFLPGLNLSLNREERIAVALNVGNEGNLQRLLNGQDNGRGSIVPWTPLQVQEVLDTLTEAEWKFVQGVWDFFEDTYKPQVAAKQKRVTGVEPEWVVPTPVTTPFGVLRGGYFPIVYDTNQSIVAGDQKDVELAKQQMQGAARFATTRRGHTKERAEQVTGRPLLLSLDAIGRNVNDVIHDLTWHEWLIDTNRLLKSPAIADAILHRYGPEVLSNIKSTVLDIATGDNVRQTVMDPVLNHLRAGTTIVGMGWSLSTAMINVTGFASSVVRIGPEWMLKGLYEMMGSPRHIVETRAVVHEKSEFMANRALTLNREINDVMNTIVGDRSDAQEKFRASFFWMITKTQEMVDLPTWLGAYNKATAQFPDDDAKAVALADQAVRDAQGAGQTADLAPIQRGSASMRLFTTFYSYMNTQYNLVVDATKARTRRGEYGMLAVDYLVLMAVPAMLTVVLKTLFGLMAGDDWDEEKFAKKLAAEFIAYPMSMLVGFRELAAAGQYAAGVNEFGGGYPGPAGLRAFAEITKLGQQAGQGEPDMALLKAAINTGGILLHFPGGQVARSIEGAVAMVEDEATPLALIFGPPRD